MLEDDPGLADQTRTAAVLNTRTALSSAIMLDEGSGPFLPHLFLTPRPEAQSTSGAADETSVMCGVDVVPQRRPAVVSSENPSLPVGDSSPLGRSRGRAEPFDLPDNRPSPRGSIVLNRS